MAPLTPTRTPAQQLATMERQIAQCRLALKTLIAWLPSSANGPITTVEAEQLLNLLGDPK